ncbi:uncharacterized protein KGF55_004631 [Candida pseudojiufengensis]|uniref:uncharacterized protein n=1 Tax=Candida pseudojiufengensis TaxID=497109 RepID=UPI002225977B|nr:uncharacterized protein KGF55_004631 [Candida pseudojiufengensis]KAI5960339.1 hypothetical protein KGF55_004631 [Candida pseudojiufengensis]
MSNKRVRSDDLRGNKGAKRVKSNSNHNTTTSKSNHKIQKFKQQRSIEQFFKPKPSPSINQQSLNRSPLEPIDQNILNRDTKKESSTTSQVTNSALEKDEFPIIDLEKLNSSINQKSLFNLNKKNRNNYFGIVGESSSIETEKDAIPLKLEAQPIFIDLTLDEECSSSTKQSSSSSSNSKLLVQSSPSSKLELPNESSSPSSKLELPNELSSPSSKLELPNELSSPSSKLELPNELSSPSSKLELPNELSSPSSKLELPNELSSPSSKLELPNESSSPSSSTLSSKSSPSSPKSKSAKESSEKLYSLKMPDLNFPSYSYEKNSTSTAKIPITLKNIGKSVQKVLIDYINGLTFLTEVTDDSITCLKNEAIKKNMNIEVVRPEYGLAAIVFEKNIHDLKVSNPLVVSKKVKLLEQNYEKNGGKKYDYPLVKTNDSSDAGTNFNYQIFNRNPHGRIADCQIELFGLKITIMSVYFANKADERDDMMNMLNKVLEKDKLYMILCDKNFGERLSGFVTPSDKTNLKNYKKFLDVNNLVDLTKEIDENKILPTNYTTFGLKSIDTCITSKVLTDHFDSLAIEFDLFSTHAKYLTTFNSVKSSSSFISNHSGIEHEKFFKTLEAEGESWLENITVEMKKSVEEFIKKNLPSDVDTTVKNGIHSKQFVHSFLKVYNYKLQAARNNGGQLLLWSDLGEYFKLQPEYLRRLSDSYIAQGCWILNKNGDYEEKENVQYQRIKLNETRWTEEEDSKLRQLVQQYGCDYEKISEFFPARSSQGVHDEWFIINKGKKFESQLVNEFISKFDASSIDTKITNGKHTAEFYDKFLEAVNFKEVMKKKYKTNFFSWDKVAELFKLDQNYLTNLHNHFKGEQIWILDTSGSWKKNSKVPYRSRSTAKPGVVIPKRFWTETKVAQLKAAVERIGYDFESIAREMGTTEKACRRIWEENNKGHLLEERLFQNFKNENIPENLNSQVYDGLYTNQFYEVLISCMNFKVEMEKKFSKAFFTYPKFGALLNVPFTTLKKLVTEYVEEKVWLKNEDGTYRKNPEINYRKRKHQSKNWAKKNRD